MIKKLLNPSQSGDNILKASSDLTHDSTPKLKGTVTIAASPGLNGIVLIDSKGVSQTVVVSPAATTAKTISAKLQEVIEANGYIFDKAEGGRLGLTVSAVSTNFNIVFRGDIRVTSVATIAVTTTDL